MFLLNYKINFSNQESFGRSIAALIPDMLKKLYLIDNNLSDSCLASLFEALAKCKDGGLSSLYIINNSLGSCSADSLANQFLSSKNIKHLKKFTLKNPVMNQKNINIEQIFLKLESQAVELKKLTSLNISQIQLSKECIPPFSNSIKKLSSLKFLDISATGLDGTDIQTIIS